jgi:hypothetical protein
VLEKKYYRNIDSIYEMMEGNGKSWDPDTSWDQTIFPPPTLLPHSVMIMSGEEIDAHAPERQTPLYNMYAKIMISTQPNMLFCCYLVKPKDGPKNGRTNFKPIISAGNRFIRLPGHTDRAESIIFVYTDNMII